MLHEPLEAKKEEYCLARVGWWGCALAACRQRARARGEDIWQTSCVVLCDGASDKSKLAGTPQSGQAVQKMTRPDSNWIQHHVPCLPFHARQFGPDFLTRSLPAVWSFNAHPPKPALLADTLLVGEIFTRIYIFIKMSYSAQGLQGNPGQTV